ncbi:hypothetical protein GP486_007230 [Trichoglossum hirsutum]|uniref:F-box domain-containing protein n=1 Tax=Trichoglossum hirsutum TaxID=265104 RepID=A0A9P8IG47_9PEZI|nr:hypothetical protein GP486_007230 [Trichoglossum hirsutum]
MASPSPRARPSDIDYFHVPYPPSPLDLLPGTSPTGAARNGAVDPFDRLPQEVCDQILSLLPVSALDAARYVSRTWYRRIMTNGWVLRQILEPDEEHVQSHDSQCAEALRCLARELDSRSRLTGSGSCDEAWRIRYRRCDVVFTIPGHREHVKKNGRGGALDAQSGARGITFARVSSSGSLMALVYAQALGGQDDHRSSHSVLIYHIDSAGKPELVAPIACPQDDGVPVDVDVSEDHCAGSWLAGVTFSGQKTKRLFSCLQPGQFRSVRTTALNERSTDLPVVPTSLRDVQRFCSDCCDYHKVSFSKDFNAGAILTTLDTVDAAHAQDDWVYIGRCDCSGAWLMLENLPILVGKTQRPYYLARHEQTGDLFVVRLERCLSGEEGTQVDAESETDEGFQYLGDVVPLVLLVRPHQHTSYANISVSPQVMFGTSPLQQLLRIAVLWHEADYPATEKVALYTYDVVSMRRAAPGEDGNGIGTVDDPRLPERYRRPSGWMIGTDGRWLSRPAPPQAEPFGYPSTECLLTGSGAQQTMKLKGRVSGKRVCGFERGMGGLHSSLLSPSDMGATCSSLGSIKLLGDGRKKCMIWGPEACSNTDSVRLVVLEFGKSWHNNEFWELSISENELSSNGANKSGCVGRRVDRSCACPYHDYGYRVTFPDPKAFSLPLAAENAALNISLLWPLNSATTFLSNRFGLSPAGQITGFRRYADVLVARKKDLEDRQRLRREGRELEKALAVIMRAEEQNRAQGVQATPPNASRTSGWFRWKGLRMN